MAKFIIFFCLLVASVYGHGNDSLERKEFVKTSTEKPKDHKSDSVTFIDNDFKFPENTTDDVDPLARAGFVDSLIAVADEHKNDIVKVIDSGVRFAKNRVQDSIKGTTNLFEKLQETANSVIAGATKNVNNVIHKVITTIDELTSKVPGVDIAECNEMASEVNYTASRIVSRVSICVTEQVEEGKYRVDNIAKVSDNFFVDLDLIRDRAVRCANEGNGTIEAIGCLKDALKQTYNFTQKRSPVVVKKIKRATNFIMLAIPSLAGCTALNTISKFFGSAGDSVSDIQNCVRGKMDANERAP